jgi:hypothetical protein
LTAKGLTLGSQVMVYKPDGYVLYKLWPAKSLNIPFFCAAEANMLYLESPAGIGFSYSAKQSFYALVNDIITGTSFLLQLLGCLIC